MRRGKGWAVLVGKGPGYWCAGESRGDSWGFTAGRGGIAQAQVVRIS